MITALQGDITTLDVDAIVNAANSALGGGGGVDGAIHRVAGREELAAACAALGGCDPGDAKATPGFGLPARWIIHTVGPVWRGGGDREAETLASCYRRSIEVAEELEASSVAFPAISTGVYRFPKDLAAEIAVRSLSNLETPVARVILVAFDQATFQTYRRLLAGG
jgi:O-acetyl-ADP-ribose deacetylase (regulator of RNase III)